MRETAAGILIFFWETVPRHSRKRHHADAVSTRNVLHPGILGHQTRHTRLGGGGGGSELGGGGASSDSNGGGGGKSGSALAVGIRAVATRIKAATAARLPLIVQLPTVLCARVLCSAAAPGVQGR